MAEAHDGLIGEIEAIPRFAYFIECRLICHLAHLCYPTFSPTIARPSRTATR